MSNIIGPIQKPVKPSFSVKKPIKPVKPNIPTTNQPKPSTPNEAFIRGFTKGLGDRVSNMLHITPITKTASGIKSIYDKAKFANSPEAKEYNEAMKLYGINNNAYKEARKKYLNETLPNYRNQMEIFKRFKEGK